LESRGDAATQTATRDCPDVRSIRTSGSSAPSSAARSDKHPLPNWTPLLRQTKSQHVHCVPFAWRWWERRRSRALRFRLMTRVPSRATNTSPYGNLSKSSGDSTSWRRDDTDDPAASTEPRPLFERSAFIGYWAPVPLTRASSTAADCSPRLRAFGLSDSRPFSQHQSYPPAQFVDLERCSASECTHGPESPQTLFFKSLEPTTDESPASST
jgi:hypothetical protein